MSTSICSRVGALFVLVVALVACQCATASKVNYAEVRTRVDHAFEERAHEMTAALSALQGVSKETAALLDRMHAQCGASLRETAGHA